MSVMKRSSTTSTNCVWFVLGLTILILSTEFVQVDCRALRSTSSSSGGGGCKQGDGAEEVAAGMASFAVSSNYNSSSSTTHHPVRSLAFRLASGPSKKGPGH